MEISKDIYVEKIAMMVDDKTLINMLSVNKKYYQYFQYVFSKKYPLLVDFKEADQSWKQFYIRMTEYLYKLEKSFGIKYHKIADFHPEHLFNFIFSVQNEYVEYVEYIIDKHMKNEKYMNTRLYLLEDGSVRMGDLNKGNLISTLEDYFFPFIKVSQFNYIFINMKIEDNLRNQKFKNDGEHIVQSIIEGQDNQKKLWCSIEYMIDARKKIYDKLQTIQPFNDKEKAEENLYYLFRSENIRLDKQNVNNYHIEGTN